MVRAPEHTGRFGQHRSKGTPFVKSKTLSAAILSLSLLFAFAAGAGAQELGARAHGLGGAYVALADDIASLVYNPAGLTRSSFEVGIGLGSSDLTAVTRFMSLFDDSSELSGDAALDVATLIGVSIGSFGAGLALQGSVAASDACPGMEFCAEGEYLSQIILGYGRSNVGMGFGAAGLRAGLSVKRLDARRIDYQKTLPAGGTYVVTTEDWRGEGYSASLGAQLEASEIFTIGIAANDFVSSLTWAGERTVSTYDEDDKLQNKVPTDLGSKHDRLDPVYRFSVAVKPPFLGVTLAGDLGSDGSVRYGVEKALLFGALTVRFGGIRVSGTATTTAGLGLRLGPVLLDAAAASSDGFKTMSTMIEGSVRF